MEGGGGGGGRGMLISQNPRVGGRSTAPSVGLTECHNVLPRAKLQLIE